MKKLCWLIVSGALAAALYAQAPAAAAAGSAAGKAEIDEIVQELSGITGLKTLEHVDYDHIPRERVKAFLAERVKESVKPEEIRAEEASLKKLGFVPQDFDLEKTTLDLLSEQAAAFYDYRKRKLFLIDAGPDLVQHSALVHELAHALADQHFHLEKFMEHGSKNDDSALARLAVMEGQATWIMSEYLTRKTGQSLKDAPVLVKLMSSVAESSTGQFPVFDKSPLYLRETLIFPYTQGMLFQHAVVEKMDKAAFTEVFHRPPATTQQILHPEKYFANVKAVRPALPELVHERDYRNFTDGELGELDHSVLLRQYAGQEEAAALAPEWKGGFFRLLEAKHGDNKNGGGAAPKRTVLAYASEWSSPEKAEKFFQDYRKVLAGKWKHYEEADAGPASVSGRGDDGYFLLRLSGTRVTSLEGMDSPAAARQAGGWL